MSRTIHAYAQGSTYDVISGPLLMKDRIGQNYMIMIILSRIGSHIDVFFAPDLRLSQFSPQRGTASRIPFPLYAPVPFLLAAYSPDDYTFKSI